MPTLNTHLKSYPSQLSSLVSHPFTIRNAQFTLRWLLSYFYNTIVKYNQTPILCPSSINSSSLPLSNSNTDTQINSNPNPSAGLETQTPVEVKYRSAPTPSQTPVQVKDRSSRRTTEFLFTLRSSFFSRIGLPEAQVNSNPSIVGLPSHLFTLRSSLYFFLYEPESCNPVGSPLWKLKRLFTSPHLNSNQTQFNTLWCLSYPPRSCF